MDQSAIDELAQTFMRARQTGERLDALPAHLSAEKLRRVQAVMAAVDKLVGEPIVGTKIAAKPGAEVVYAPLPAGRVFNSPARVPRALTPSQYMECEISFRLTRDLPPRDDRLFRGRGVRRAGGLRRVRAGRQPLPRSERRRWRRRRTSSTPTTSPTAPWCSARSARTGRNSISPRPASRCGKAAGPSSRKPAAIRPAIRPSPPWCWRTCAAATTGLKAGHFIVTGSFTGFHSVELNKPVTGEFDGFGTMEATIVGSTPADADPS